MKLTALKIAVRDLRASWTRFLFVVIAVAAGVGALTGVRGFSESFRDMLFREARTLIAADVFVRIFAQPTDAQQAAVDALVQRGAVMTPVTETMSMAASTRVGDPALVTLKSVDPDLYPLYGEVTVEPAASLKQLLRPDSVVVSDDLMLRLRTSIGDTVRLGGKDFRISAVLIREPDRMSGSFSVGPRILLSREALERTGLVGVGSRASQRLLFRTGSLQLPAVEAELRRAFPEALIVNFREMNPNVQRGIQRATTFLSLVSLIALIVGAIGVATAMQAHLQTRMDSIAIMKSIGGRSGQVLSIYLTQTVLLGLIGGVLGIAAGFAVQAVFPELIERFLQIRPEIVLSPATALQGIALGVLTTVLFTLPPLLSVREIRPALIFRRDMAEVRPSLRQRLSSGWRSALLGLLLCLGLAGVAATLVGGSWEEKLRIGVAFVGALVVSLIALSIVGSALLRALQLVVARMPGLPMAARHALSNLYRPGSQSRAVLTALGVGVMFTLTVYLVQRSVLDEIRRNAPPGMANVFFIDISPEQREPLLGLLARQPGLERSPDVVATVSARLVAINGVALDDLQLGRGVSRRYRRARNISTESTLPAGTEIVRGAWWNDATSPVISVTQDAARNLKVDVGSTMTWNAYGRDIEATVAAVHRTDERRLRSMLEFHMNPEGVEGLPIVNYASARIQARSIGAVQRAVYQQFPTVTVINVADVLDRVQEVVDQIALVIRFISGFAIFAGAIILASSVAGTRFRRVREMAIFKTLGATRGLIVRMFSAEFLILGFASGLIGSLLATAFTWVLLRRFFEDVPFQINLPAILVSVTATAAVASVAGWLASFPILGQKPLEVLRGE